MEPAADAVPPTTTSQKVEIGPGDQVRVEVFGDPDLTTTTAVDEDGSIRLPLVGAVPIGGHSPTEGARIIERALVSGEFLVDPRVTLTVLNSSSQRVSVLGEVRNPGRYPVESNTTVLDVIALAGGITNQGSDEIYILREDKSGKRERLNVDTRGFMDLTANNAAPPQLVKGGDSIIVPKATFIVTGQVVNPGEYKVENGMTLFQALARAGGVTAMGSASRVKVRRRNDDGKEVNVKGKKDLIIKPGDVITVKERLF